MGRSWWEVKSVSGMDRSFPVFWRRKENCFVSKAMVKDDKGTKCWFFWYAGLLCAGVFVLDLAVLEGTQWMTLTTGHELAQTVLDFVNAGGGFTDSPDVHISGTSLVGSAALQFRHHVHCFSKSGRWVYDPTPRYLVPNVFGSEPLQVCEKQFLNRTAGAVAGDRANQIAASGRREDWIVREDLKWEWRTDELVCPLADIDRAQFCRRIGSNRNMLVVGDSINQELYWILLNNLVNNRSGWALPRSSAERNVRGDHQICEDVLGGPGRGFHIGHIRNDRLSTSLHISEDRQTGFFEFPWINQLDPWNISLLLLNRGAHFEPDEVFEESLLNLFTLLKHRWPKMLVFYRNTPPGHMNCTSFDKPLEERESVDALRKWRRYNWAGFARQNEIARNITERFGYIFLDLDAIMAVRADGHRSETDCLHYCLPGPLDIFAKLFYNTLLLLPPSPL